jgi:hypothetical protein
MKNTATAVWIGCAACGLLLAQGASKNAQGASKNAQGASKNAQGASKNAQGASKSSAPASSPKPTATLGDKIVVTKMDASDFPTGGLLRMTNAVGELTITGWDQPNLEMTTIKSTKTAVEVKDRDQANKLLDNVKISLERKGDELDISTAFPKHSKIARPFVGMTDFDLEYRIQAPRAAHLDIAGVMGEVHIENIRGDIRAKENLGEITVRVPDGMYAIDARSKLGAVNSDFPGTGRQLQWWVVKWPGQAFMASAPAAAQKMFLRSSYGDIVILRMH